MLLWPEVYQHPELCTREALTHFMKHEADPDAAENGAESLLFQCVLCAATSPAVKLQDETLTYLNQGQPYELRMLNRRFVECMRSKCVKSIVRVVFHDRRLQYTEHQQLEGWRWNRPGDRILDIDIALSVGIIEPRAHPLQLNTVEFLWNPAKSTSVFVQVNCISTEFTPRKHGGEKGVPFRIQVDTFLQNERGEYLEHVHSSSCQIKVFKPKGADRKLKTDREKIEKKSLHDREKYHPSYEISILTECSPWPDSTTINSTSSIPSSECHISSTSYSFPNGNGCPDQPEELLLSSGSNLVSVLSSQETQEWLHLHRFSSYCRLFISFSGADLLKMSREDFIQICGRADGIRLFNTIKGRCLQPRLTVYVSQQKNKNQSPNDTDDNNVYHALYLEELTLLELTEKIANLYSIPAQQICHVYRQGPMGIHIRVSDEMVQNFTEETRFLISTRKVTMDESNEGYHVLLK